ncbi:MAG: hypothetical protein ABSH03_09935 [Candidatus Lustribacter sp.]
MDSETANPETIVQMLFQAAMSKDPGAWCQENQVPQNLLASWKERYHREYIEYLEKVLRVIRSRVDY